MIQLVVFDMAGTTVEDGDAVNASFRSALAGAGIKADRESVSAVMGLPKPEAVRILLAGAGKPFTEAEADAIHEDFIRRMCAYYEVDASVREVPGASAAFAALRGTGIKVALNTGFNRKIADTVLKRLGWHSPAVIDAAVASDEVQRGRPFPDMIQLLMTRLGISDSRCVAKVGDTKADLDEGANAKCGLNIGVTSGAFTREQLAGCSHTHIVGSVAEVPGLLTVSMRHSP